NNPGAPVSIFFTVRNEEENLWKQLPTLLQIRGVEFEVIVVDDYSQDNSLSVLGLLNQRYKHLRISSLSQETRFSVKLAQNVALKSATNDWVMQIPVSINEINEDWLKQFSEKIDNSKKLVIAYSSVVSKKGLYNMLFRIENFFQYVKSAGYISNRISFVYSEENLAFNKKNYFDLNGYGSKVKEPFANLELIINSFIRKNATSLIFNRETSIFKNVEVGHSEYFDLLKKSFRIENHLPWWKQLILNIDKLIQLIFLPLVITVFIVIQGLWPVFISLLSIYLIAYLLIIKIALNRLNERKIFIPSLVYGLIMPYFILFYRWHFANKLRRKWKNKV
ncbi:MAG: glycosyltransferase, partial [Draconibacterium sp.]|nr:glycosyltransferase [Draconibacterium sp.]